MSLRTRVANLERSRSGSLALVVREYQDDTPESYAARLEAAREAATARRGGRLVLVDDAGDAP